jgi:hypothetical protein
VGQHGTARRNQRRTQLTHAAVSADIFGMDALRFGEQPWNRVAFECFNETAHTRHGPAQVHGSRTRSRQQLQVRPQRIAPAAGVGAVALLRPQHHAIGGGDADCRGPAHDHISNRLGSIAQTLDVKMLQLPRQQPLVDQLDTVVFPLNRANTIVGNRFLVLSDHVHPRVRCFSLMAGPDSALTQRQIISPATVHYHGTSMIDADPSKHTILVRFRSTAKYDTTSEVNADTH